MFNSKIRKTVHSNMIITDPKNREQANMRKANLKKANQKIAKTPFFMCISNLSDYVFDRKCCTNFVAHKSIIFNKNINFLSENLIYSNQL